MGQIYTVKLVDEKIVLQKTVHIALMNLEKAHGKLERKLNVESAKSVRSERKLMEAVKNEAGVWTSRV